MHKLPSTSDLDRFYEILARLKNVRGQHRPLAEYSGRSGWPQRGVYFFTEPGENRAQFPDEPRIVRVETHAVRTNSKSKLWGRLRTHRGGQDGSGNHRGSIFRLHVGAALLRRDGTKIAELPSWGLGKSAPREICAIEKVHEKRVSAHLGDMSVLWIDVPDNPGPRSLRSFVEQNAIALLSNRKCPLDPPSENWLGLCSVREEIRKSGLWNVDHVDKEFDPGFLEALAEAVNRTPSRIA